MAATTKGTWRVECVANWDWRPEGKGFHVSYRKGWSGPVPEASALAGEAAGSFRVTRRPKTPRAEAER